jgi:ApbE superfamily uncharacterized protein (UPF0280 family)
MYEARDYRNVVKTDDLVNFEVIVKETDLLVRTKRDLSKETRESVLKYRHQLETYMGMHAEFQRSLVPMDEDPYAPEIIGEMIELPAASVGPAAVAGAMSIISDLLQLTDEIIVKRRDIFLVTSKDHTIGIYAGPSSLSLKLGITIHAADSPLGVCTSSGTVGPSLSLGKTDAVSILSKSAALADAAATAVGNVVRKKEDIESGLERGKQIDGVLGVLIILGENVGVWGKMNLVQLKQMP